MSPPQVNREAIRSLAERGGLVWLWSSCQAQEMPSLQSGDEFAIPPPRGGGGEPRGPRTTGSPRRCAPSAGLRIPRRGPQDSARLERTPTLAPPSPERPTLRRPRPRPAPAPPGDLGLRPPPMPDVARGPGAASPPASPPVCPPRPGPGGGGVAPWVSPIAAARAPVRPAEVPATHTCSIRGRGAPR